MCWWWLKNVACFRLVLNTKGRKENLKYFIHFWIIIKMENIFITFIFKRVINLLFERYRIRGMEEETETKRYFCVSHMDDRGPSTWATICCLLKCIIRVLDWKLSSQDLNKHSYMECWCHKQWLKSFYHKASPYICF